MLSALFRRRVINAHAPEVKSAPPLIALSLVGAPRWGGRDYPALARLGVMKNAIVYRCVRMIAEAAASVPWLLYEGDTEIESHPLLSLLQNPNGRQPFIQTFNARSTTVTLIGADVSIMARL